MLTDQIVPTLSLAHQEEYWDDLGQWNCMTSAFYITLLNWAFSWSKLYEHDSGK